jgi:Cu-processing system permease protein
MAHPVRVIAFNTFKEIIRDRILYGIVVFAFLLIGLSLLLGQLTFQEQMKLSLDYGFFGIQLCAVVLSIFVGSSLVNKEIEKQTILTLLARPIKRSQFLIGKFFGLMAVNALVLSGLGLVLFLVSMTIGFEPSLAFFAAISGIFFEAMVLLSLTLLFGSFSRPIMTVVFAIGFFIIGHWVNDLHFFAQKSESSSFKTVGTWLSYALPNLESFNWRSLPVYSEVLSLNQFTMGLLIAFGWTILFLSLTVIIFRKRDFV